MATPMESHLIASVHESLSLYLYDNAKFLGERLVALSATEGNINLLAVCYYQANQAYRAYHLLKNTGLSSHNSRYLYAMCCLQLGKLHDAREVLTKSGDREVPHGAAGLYLLGRVYRLVGRAQDAREHFVRALRLNPLMWCAYEELCALGGDEEAHEICSYAASCQAAVAASQLPPSRPPAADGAPAATNPADAAQAPGAAAGTEAAGVHGSTALAPSPLSSQAPIQLVECASPGPTPAPVSSLNFGMSYGPPDTACTADVGPHSVTGPARGAAGAGAGPTASTGTTAAPMTVSTGGMGSAAAGSLPVFGARGAGGAAGWQTPGVGGAFITPAAGSQGSQGLFGSPMSCVAGAGGDMSTGGDRTGSVAGMMHTGGVSYMTPVGGGGSLAPPAPPQKHGGGGVGMPGAQASDTFPGFSAGMDSGPMAGGGPAAPHGRNGPRGVPDDGRPRKVGGKSLFHDAGSVRRSSRLAALASGPPNGPASGTAPGTTASTTCTSSGQGGGFGGLVGVGPMRGGSGGGAGAGNGAAGGFVHQSQNQPDPAYPPPAPTHPQAVFDAKLGGVAEGPVGRGGGGQAYAVGCHLGSDGGGRPGAAKSQEGQVRVLAVLRFMYEAYRHLAMYRAAEALQAFKQLPQQQYRTAWVHVAVARAHFEAMDYHAAAAAFETARQLDRQRVEGMELYSTVLWHMKRYADLSYLAQDLMAVDRLAPQSWCVLGNFFSLQKDHEAALRLFERALQLEPAFTYAYTLSGHEYAANEDFDKALTCYRNALRFDGRHYNAMYGMGQIYFRQEKYDVALCHFRQASGINPRSSVLRCYTGIALAKQGIHDKALAKLQEAVELDPRNPLARYEHACVLAACGDVGGALGEMEALAGVVPAEASVYFQMGKLHKRLGNLRAAQAAYEAALARHCSSADAGAIKGAIEKLGVNEEEEEEEL